MEWWQRSIHSNIDIKGECSIAPVPTYEEIDEEILVITDENNKHTPDTLELIKTMLPNVKVRVIQAENPHETVTQLNELCNSGLRSKILLCQWYVAKNAKIDLAMRRLINKQDFLVVASAGNKNEPFKSLSPLNVKEVMKVGSYNRKGIISAMCNELPCDYYFPGTSIKINNSNKMGTSYAAVIAVITFLILKHKYQSRSYKEFRYVHLKEHELPFENKLRIILNDIHGPYEFPTAINVDQAGKIVLKNDRLSFYLEFNDEFEEMLLIDAMGLAIKKLGRDDIVVPMSGGVDSESIAQACIKHNVKFEPVIMRYTYDNEIRNEYDYVYAEEFCRQHNLTPTYLDLNLNWFFEESEEFLKYVTMCGASSPQFCCHFWMLDQINGFPIMPGDPVTLQNRGEGFYIAIPFFKFFAYDYYIQATRKPGIAHMSMYNTNVIMNSLLIAYKLLNEPNSNKLDFFRLGGFEINDVRSKMTGFEEIRQRYSDKYNEEHTIRKFDEFFREPLFWYFPHKHKTNVFIDDQFRKNLK